MELKEANRRFFNIIARYYDFLFRKAFDKVEEKAIEIAKINKGKVLDAGCGTGNFLLKLSENKKLKLYGADISEKMLEIARKKLGNKAKLILVEAEKVKGSYDYVFGFEAFHHLDKNKAMKNFYKVLKRNGKLIIVDLDFWIFNKLFEKIEPGNTGLYSAKELENIFKAYNFKDIKQEKIGLNILTYGRKGGK